MPPIQNRASGYRPDCPKCGMQMIVTKGAKLEPERKTYECLRCGHEPKPGPGEVY
jgi:predicted RNA-binding Zn-ribbon protein involved in translation (DUF1610 family)